MGGRHPAARHPGRLARERDHPARHARPVRGVLPLSPLRRRAGDVRRRVRGDRHRRRPARELPAVAARGRARQARPLPEPHPWPLRQLPARRAPRSRRGAARDRGPVRRVQQAPARRLAPGRDRSRARRRGARRGAHARRRRGGPARSRAGGSPGGGAVRPRRDAAAAARHAAPVGCRGDGRDPAAPEPRDAREQARRHRADRLPPSRHGAGRAVARAARARGRRAASARLARRTRRSRGARTTWRSGPSARRRRSRRSSSSCRSGERRILRAVMPPPAQPDASPLYEIFHDILAEPILEWCAEREAERERARLALELEAARARAPGGGRATPARAAKSRRAGRGDRARRAGRRPRRRGARRAGPQRARGVRRGWPPPRRRSCRSIPSSGCCWRLRPCASARPRRPSRRCAGRSSRRASARRCGRATRARARRAPGSRRRRSAVAAAASSRSRSRRTAGRWLPSSASRLRLWNPLAGTASGPGADVGGARAVAFTPDAKRLLVVGRKATALMDIDGTHAIVLRDAEATGYGGATSRDGARRHDRAGWRGGVGRRHRRAARAADDRRLRGSAISVRGAGRAAGPVRVRRRVALAYTATRGRLCRPGRSF